MSAVRRTARHSCSQDQEPFSQLSTPQAQLCKTFQRTVPCMLTRLPPTDQHTPSFVCCMLSAMPDGKGSLDSKSRPAGRSTHPWRRWGRTN